MCESANLKQSLHLINTGISKKKKKIFRRLAGDYTVIGQPESDTGNCLSVTVCQFYVEIM